MSFFVSSLSFCPEKTGRLQEPDPASPGRALLCLTARLCHRSRNQTAFPADCLTVKDKIPCSFMVFEEPALFVFSEESKFCSLEGGFDARSLGRAWQRTCSKPGNESDDRLGKVMDSPCARPQNLFAACSARANPKVRSRKIALGATSADRSFCPDLFCSDLFRTVWGTSSCQRQFTGTAKCKNCQASNDMSIEY